MSGGGPFALAARWALGLGLVLVVVNAFASQRGDTVLVHGIVLPVLGTLDISLEAIAEGAVLALRLGVVMAAFAVHAASVDPDRVLRLLRPIASRSALTATLIARMVPLAAADYPRLGEAASYCRIARSVSRPTRIIPTASRRESGRSTRSSRGCCSKAASCSARSGSWADPMQPQAHLQFVSHLLDGADPQGALDAGRFRVQEGREVALEPGLWQYADDLRALGHEPLLDEDVHPFGVGQAILKLGDAPSRAPIRVATDRQPVTEARGRTWQHLKTT